eukprot:5720328-Pleurochrysis_carterae.AAC.1
MATFIPFGYAAACLARATPAASRPCATSSCPPDPCTHCAASRSAHLPSRPRAYAIVVYLRERAPSAHCAKVTMPAPIPPSASHIAGITHIGACVANCGHHARPR